MSAKATPPRVRSASRPRCVRRSNSPSTATALNAGGVQRRICPRQSMGQPGKSLLSKGLPGSEARRRQGQGAVEGGRRHRAVRRRLHGAEGRRDAGRRRGDPGDGVRDRHQHENPRHRVRHLAQAGRSKATTRPICWPGAGAPIRTATSISSTNARRRRTTPAIAIRKSTSCSTNPACRRISPTRKAIYKKDHQDRPRR